MVSLEKWMILTPLLKLPKNGEDWGKLIVAKVKNITQSGHTDHSIFNDESLVGHTPDI